MIRCVKNPFLVVVSVVLAAAVSCKKEEPKESSPLDEAVRLVSPPDFGERYDKGLALLSSLAGDPNNLEAAYTARFHQALAHLDLFVTALLTEDAALFEKCKAVLNWELEGDIRNLRNFQLLIQDVMEEFKLVSREGGKYPELAARAEDLASYCLGLQGLFYRDKREYMAGRERVSRHSDLAYLADLMAIRDLVHETLRREDGTRLNWQNLALTVLGPVCLRPALKYVDMLCIPADPSLMKEHCEPDFDKLSAGARQEGARFLTEQCTFEGAGEEEAPVGMAAVRSYYDGAFNRVAAARERLAPRLGEELASLRKEMDKAYGELEAFVSYSSSPPKSK